MSTKTLIYICLGLGGVLGGWLGSQLDNGNIFGLWGILGSTVGALLGIWAGFKFGQAN